MLTRQKLITLQVVEAWSENMSTKFREKIKSVLQKNQHPILLTLECESEIKRIAENLISNDAEILLRKLLADSNGIEWEKPDHGCPSMELINLALARYDTGNGERLLKPTRFAFYPEIQYLAGLTTTY